jgi:hypothetical protein
MYKKNSTTKEIEFSYPVDGIFDSAARVSAYNSKNIRDNQGNSLLAEYAISDDDKDVFTQGVNSVLPEIYEKIIKITDRTDADSFEIRSILIETVVAKIPTYNADGSIKRDEAGNIVYEKDATTGAEKTNTTKVYGDCIIFTIKDNDSYNANVLKLVDQSFLECIIEGALKMWYKNCAQADLLALYNKSFADNLEKLFNRMFQLKIKKTSNMLGAKS